MESPLRLNRIVVVAFVGVLLASGLGPVQGYPTGAAGGDRGSLDSPERVVEGRATSTDALAMESASTHPLRSGEAAWRGWSLSFDGSRIVADPASASEAERTFELWTVDDGGQVDSRIRTFTVDADGTAVLSTENVIGRFVVRYDDDPVYVEDGVGYRSSPPDGTSVTTENSAFRVREQTLSTTWEDGEVYDGQATALTLRSNRADFVVAVSSPGLSYDDLTTLFSPDSYARDHDSRADQDVLLLAGGSERTYTVNASGLPVTATLLEFSASDTTGGTETSLRVVAPPASPRITDIERTEEAGDVVDLTVACGSCYLFVGGPGEGLLDVVEVSDADGDGNVTLHVNTRYVGMDLSQAGVPSSVTGYAAEGGSVRRLSAGDFVSPPGQRDSYGLGTARTNLGIPSNGRSSPVPPGSYYDFTVSASQYIAFQGEPYDEGYTVEDERHVQSVVITEPGVSSIHTRVVHGGAPETLDIPGLAAATTGSDRVAIGNRFVIEIRASGLHGYLSAIHGEAVDGIVDNDAEGLDLELAQSDASATARNRIDPVLSDARLLADPDADRLFVVMDTDDLEGNRPVEPGERYLVSFTLDGGAGYPYLDGGETRRGETTVTFVAPAAEITSREVSGDRVTFSGTTTLAPGSLLSVRASAKGSFSWKRATGVDVSADRTWEATIGFGDAPGSEYVVTVSYEGTSLETLDPVSTTPTPRPDTPVAGTATSPDGPGGSPGPQSSPGATNGTASGPNGTDTSPGPGGAGPAGPGNDGSGIPFLSDLPFVGGVVGIVVVAGAILLLLALLAMTVLG